jgi:hypothetical protein
MAFITNVEVAYLVGKTARISSGKGYKTAILHQKQKGPDEAGPLSNEWRND